MTAMTPGRHPSIRRHGPRLAAAVGTLALASPAIAGGATRALPSGFVPYRSISAVRLGMDEKTVERRLGTPSGVNRGSLGGGHGPSQLIYSHRSPKQSLIITFDQHRRGDPVARIQASGGPFRTARGVGIGSSRAAVHRAFAHLRSENGSLVGHRGPAFMEIDFVHGHVALLGLADTRLRSFAAGRALDR